MRRKGLHVCARLPLACLAAVQSCYLPTYTYVGNRVSATLGAAIGTGAYV